MFQDNNKERCIKWFIKIFTFSTQLLDTDDVFVSVHKGYQETRVYSLYKRHLKIMSIFLCSLMIPQAAHLLTKAEMTVYQFIIRLTFSMDSRNCLLL